MKKILSIVLALAMIASMFAVIPVMAEETEATVPADTSTLGDYYKFTFGEDGDRYEYTVANKNVDDTTGQATYKGNTFYPFWLPRTANTALATYEYKTVDIGGTNYDVLEVKNAETVMLVPMTKEGKPFEMVPGVQYSVNVKLFNPTCSTWGQYSVTAGSTDIKSTGKVNGVRYNKNATTGEVTSSAYQASAYSPFVSVAGGVVSGQEWAVYLKEGSYGTSNITLNCICSQYKEDVTECEHSSKTVNAYKSITNVLSIPEENATYDEATNSYSIKTAFVDETPDDTSDDTYDDVNNYLALNLGGAKINAYTSKPIYANATAEEIGDATTTWQIVSIEVISENYKPTVKYVANGEVVNSVSLEPDSALPAYIPNAPAGKYFAGWYKDAEYTEVFSSNVMPAQDTTLYARFADYGYTYTYNFDKDVQSANYYHIHEDGTVSTKFDRLGWCYRSNEDGAEIFYTNRTWGQSGRSLLVDENDNLFIVDPSKKYAVTVKYKMIESTNDERGNVYFRAGIGVDPADYKDLLDKGFIASSSMVQITEVQDEWQTVTLTVDPTEMDSKYIPAIGIIVSSSHAVDPENPEFSGLVEKGIFNKLAVDSIEIRTLDGTITYVKADGTEKVVDAYKGQEINYPAFAASNNGDAVWSLSADEYIAPPAVFTENVTIYEFNDGIIGAENYYYAAYAETSLDIRVTDELAYEGDKAIKFQNRGFSYKKTQPTDWETNWNKYYVMDEEGNFVKLESEEAPVFEPWKFYELRKGSDEHSISLWNLPGGQYYKINFKYYVPAELTTDVRLSPYTNIYNLWAAAPYRVNYTESRVVISKNTETGKWLDGYILINNQAPVGADFLFLKVAGVDANDTNDIIYFDNFTYEVVEEVATFNIALDDAVVNGLGTYADGVYVSYDLNAPTVTVEGGASIETWYTDEAYTEEATEFVAGGVYYGTIGCVEYVDGSKVTKAYYNKDDVIAYAEFTALRNYDVVWSLSPDEYIAVPKTFSENITVYTISSPVISFENYYQADYAKYSYNVTVSEDIAFSGYKAIKYQNVGMTFTSSEPADWAEKWTEYYEIDAEGNIVALGGEEAPVWAEYTYLKKRDNAQESSIVLWDTPAGKTYKVSFKYFVPAELTTTITLNPYTNNSNLWSPAVDANGAPYGNVSYPDSKFSIGTDVATGEWLDGEIYFTSAANNKADILYLGVAAETVGSGDLVYFDDFTLTEVQIATFIIPEDATFEDGGILKDNVVTVYAEIGEEIIAPLVIDAEGNPVEIWKDAEGKVVDAFVNGGVYTAYVASAFVYGDCNDDGAVDTTDLAALKLFLAGSGEAGLGADCDASGNIDTGDLAALKLFLAGTGNLGPAE